MNKWQERAIKSLMNRGYDALTASRLYERAYKRLSSSVISKGFDRAFETYASLTQENNFIKFDIKNNRLYYRKTGEDVSSETFEKSYTRDRLGALAGKYDTIEEYVEEYEAGEITLTELNEKIRQFKRTNSEYHKEGS